MTKKQPGIRRTDKGFEIRVTYTDPKTGRKKDRRVHVQGISMQEAQIRRARIMEELRDTNGSAKRERLQLGTYAVRWSKARAYKWKPSTRDRYANALEKHILPVLGDIYLDSLTSEDILHWVSLMASSKAKATTVNGWLGVLRAILRDALAEGHLERDVTYRIAALPTTPSERPTLSRHELRAFLLTSAKVAPEQHPLFVTGFFTGARFGELAALRWEDIDEDAGVVHYQRSHYMGQVGTTKTGRTRRVPVAPLVVNTLREHRRRMIERQHRGLSTGLVFPANVVPETARYKGHRSSSSIQKALDLVCTEAGINKRLTSHAMRRTFNNLLRQEGVDRVALRAMTGHSSERMTEHYSDVGMEEKREAVSALMGGLEIEPDADTAKGLGVDKVDRKVDASAQSGSFRVVTWTPDAKKPRQNRGFNGAGDEI